MDRLTWQQLRNLLDFLRDCYACHDQKAFVTHLLGGISTLISSEVTSYVEIDLRSGQVGDGTRVTPADVRFPEDQAVFAAHMAEHPIITYCQQTGDCQAVMISDFLTQRQFHRLRLYQEFFRWVDVEDQMSTVLPARPPYLIGIGLHRGRRTFSERDRLVLNLLRPHLAQVYQSLRAITALPQEIIVLSREGRVRLMTPCARDWLTTYFGPTKVDSLPEALETWRTHQEAALDRADDVPPPREPLRVQRNGTCLLVRHLCEAEQCVLLLEERQTAREPVSFAKGGLTRREAEVLQWVARGKTNAEIGCILGLSPRTVQKHLEHTYEKLGVETRVAAATLALSGRLEG